MHFYLFRDALRIVNQTISVPDENAPLNYNRLFHLLLYNCNVLYNEPLPATEFDTKLWFAFILLKVFTASDFTKHTIDHQFSCISFPWCFLTIFCLSEYMK